MKPLLPYIIAICTSAYAGPWQDSYTPSKLEWFAVELNTRYQWHSSTALPIGISYNDIPPNTIELFVTYTNDVDLEVLKRAVESAKENVRKRAKLYPYNMKVHVKEVTRKVDAHAAHAYIFIDDADRSPASTPERRGCCSHHGGVPKHKNCSCKDGTYSECACP